MRKVFLLVVFLFLPFFLIAGDLSYRSLSMGGIKSSVFSQKSGGFENPAALFFNEESNRLYLSGNWQVFIPSDFPITDCNELSVSFVGKSILLDFEVNGWPEKTEENLFDLYRSFLIESKVAIGIGSFSAGLGFKGGSTSVRSSVMIGKDNYPDIITESLFGRFRNLEERSIIELSLGLFYKYKGFSAGVLCENIFADSSASKFAVTTGSVLDSLDAGIYWSRDRFRKRGKRNSNVFSIGVEIQKMSSDSERTLNAGFEYLYQFSRKYSIALRLGTSYLFSKESDSTQSLGIAYGFENGEVTLFFTAPYSFYTDEYKKMNVNLAFNMVF